MLAVVMAMTASAVPVKTTSGNTSALPVIPTKVSAGWEQPTNTTHGVSMARPLTAKEINQARAAQGRTSRVIAESVPELRGWIIWPSTMLGLFTLPKTDDAGFAPVGTSAYGVINGGGYDDGHGTYRGVYYEQTSSGVAGVQIMEFDAQTFELKNVNVLDVAASQGIIAMDVDIDPTSGQVYGCYLTDDARGYCWGRGDYATGQRTLIANLSAKMVAVGCDAQGQFYALLADGALVKVDKTTGSLTTVGATSVPTDGYLAGYAAGGAIDRATGKMYVTYITTDDESGIYEIDLATAESASAVKFKTPAMVLAPFFATEAAEGMTPAAPGLEVSAPEGTLSASYSIQMPSLAENGSALSGMLDWELYVDGILAESASAEAGTIVTGIYVLATPGMVNFSATVGNAAGKSPATAVSLFVGNGVPAAPAGVSASWADGTMTVTWEAVSETTDGGYLNTAALTYKVLLNDEPVATDIATTSYSYTVAEPDAPKSFSYSVKAVNDGLESQAGKAETVWLGAYSAPFATDFSPLGYNDKAEDLGYTIIDANEDGSTWGPLGMGKGMRYRYHSSNQADDWLITPAVKMDAGKVYNFTAFVSSYGASDEERFEVKAGMGVAPETMTVEVIPATTILNT